MDGIQWSSETLKQKKCLLTVTVSEHSSEVSTARKKKKRERSSTRQLLNLRILLHQMVDCAKWRVYIKLEHRRDDLNPTFNPNSSRTLRVCVTVQGGLEKGYFLFQIHGKVQNVLFSPHEQYIYIPCCTQRFKKKKKTATAMKIWQSGCLFQLLDLWAASHITSHKSTLSVKQNTFTRDKYIIFFIISFVLNIMHVYKIKTRSKLHRTTQRVSVNWIHWECSWLLPLRWNHPLLQGFHCCRYFCAMEQDWRGETLKARSFLCGEECRKKRSPPPPHIPLLPCVPPGPFRRVFRSFASRLGYRDWMSWLMDTKQRCPWWRRVRKTRKHSGFKHTHPTPLFLFLSDSLSASVCSQSA